MKTIYDIQQFLKRFGFFVYLGDRVAEYELMEAEISELYQMQMIDIKDYQTAILLLRHHITLEKKQKK